MELSPADILYEDEWLLAVAKPAGLPVHATVDRNRDHLVAALGRLLQARDGRIGYLGLQHRLDVDTSGIVVLTRQEAANQALSQAFSQRTADKVYLALTVRPADLPPPTWTVRNHLAPNKQGRPPMHAVRAGGDPAWTEFTLRGVTERALLVEAHLKTGRRHQIRVHLADLGLPILGDRDYGAANGHPAPPPLAPRCMLHAWRLRLDHPQSAAPLALECPPPVDFRATAERLGLAIPK